MLVVGTLLAKLGLDDSDFEKGLGRGNKKMQSVGKSMMKMGGVMSLGITAPLLAGAKAAVDAATDIGESLNKNEVLFGRHAAGIAKWSQGTATQFGISRRAALEYTGTFGNLFIAMGMAEGKSAGMSQKLVELSADMASFNNADPTEVLDALRSGLVGETEPLRRFGVQLSATRVEAYAQSKGIKASYSEMDPAAKATLAYELILKDTAKAQGDFANTSDSAANRARILAAQVDDTKAKFGNLLLPIWQKVLDVGLKLVGFFMKMPGPMKTVTLIVLGLIAALGPLLIVIGSVVAAIGTIGLAASGIIVGVAALIAVLVWAYLKFETFRNVVNAVMKAVWMVVKTVFGLVVGIFRNVFGVIQGLFRAFSALFRGDWRALGQALRQIVSNLGGILHQLFVRAMAAIARAVWAGIKLLWRWWGNLPGQIVGFLNRLPGMLQRLFLAVLRAAWEGAKRGWEMVKAFFRNIPGWVKTAVGNLDDVLLAAGRQLMDGLWNGIRERAPDVARMAASLMKSVIPGPIEKVLGVRSPSTLMRYYGQQTMKGMALGLNDEAKRVQQTMAAAMGGLGGSAVAAAGHQRRVLGGGRGGGTWPARLRIVNGELMVELIEGGAAAVVAHDSRQEGRRDSMWRD